MRIIRDSNNFYVKFKIWFKSAYQCVCCGYIIHIKCYEKTIGKAICPRFYTKQASTGSVSTVASFTNSVNAEDHFVVIQPPSSSETLAATTASQPSSDAHQSQQPQQQPKSMVSNFISGIRQRASKRFQESDLPGHAASSSATTANSATSSTTSTGSAKSSLLNTFYSNFNKAKMVRFNDFSI